MLRPCPLHFSDILVVGSYFSNILVVGSLYIGQQYSVNVLELIGKYSVNVPELE